MPLVKGKVKVLTEVEKTVYVNEDGQRVCGCFLGKEDPVECAQAYQGLRMCVAEIKHDAPEDAELQERLFTVLRRRNGCDHAYYTDREMFAKVRGHWWPSV